MLNNTLNYHLVLRAKNEVNQAFNMLKPNEIKSQMLSNSKNTNFLNQNTTSNNNPLIRNNIMTNLIPNSTQNSNKGITIQDSNENYLKKTLRSYRGNDVTDKITNYSNNKFASKGLSYDEVLKIQNMNSNLESQSNSNSSNYQSIYQHNFNNNTNLNKNNIQHQTSTLPSINNSKKLNENYGIHQHPKENQQYYPTNKNQPLSYNSSVSSIKQNIGNNKVRFIK